MVEITGLLDWLQYNPKIVKRQVEGGWPAWRLPEQQASPPGRWVKSSYRVSACRRTGWCVQCALLLAGFGTSDDRGIFHPVEGSDPNMALIPCPQCQGQVSPTRQALSKMRGADQSVEKTYSLRWCGFVGCLILMILLPLFIILLKMILNYIDARTALWW